MHSSLILLNGLGSPPSASWHSDYRDTAYVYIGGLAFDLTEGDVATIFSQFGEPVWLKLARDRETGKSRGFAWLKYEDQRSADLAVDNLGGATVLGRVLAVDHTRYKKRDDEDDTEFNIAIPDGAADGEGTDEGSGEDSEEDGRQRGEPRDAITQEHEEEDPMKEYLRQERREKRKSRHRSGEGKSREHRHHHHRRHRHRSRERSKDRK